MLQILHKGIQISLDLDSSKLTGDVPKDLKTGYIAELVGGKLIARGEKGAVLADGAVHKSLGFLINDAAGYFFGNTPAIASNQVAVTLGNCVVITDQIDTDKTFVPGQLVYVGTGIKKGLVTTDAPLSGAPATADLKSIINITASFEGVRGNNFQVILANGSTLATPVVAGSEKVVRSGDIFTVYIQDKASTQKQVADVLLKFGEFKTVVADSDGTAVILANGSGDSIQFTGGLDGANSIGITDSNASAAAPSLKILVV